MPGTSPSNKGVPRLMLAGEQLAAKILFDAHWKKLARMLHSLPVSKGSSEPFGPGGAMSCSACPSKVRL